jgi:hypothetical protein
MVVDISTNWSEILGDHAFHYLLLYILIMMNINDYKIDTKYNNHIYILI